MVNSSSGLVIAVAHASDRAELLADLVERSGFAGIATTDLGWAFDESPHVLLIDPTGWQATVRTLLSRFDIRTPAPPAVLLVCEEAEALYETGPAIHTISLDSDPETLGCLITRLVSIQRDFALRWPKQIEIGCVEQVSHVIDILSERTGIEVRSDRWNLFRTAIKERIVAKLSNSLAQYEERLSGERGRRELLLLASLVVVGETHFWRYSGQMNALKSLLIARRARLGSKRRVKIWSAGCSTGEEAYSVAMAALEALGDDDDVQVFGTDLHPVHLARAAKGVYSERALRNLPPRLGERWFSGAGANYAVDEKLKARVSFSQVNFVGDELDEWIKRNGPFDSIFFRNVAIYFDKKTTKQVVSRLTDGLAEGGGLFCGSAETLRPLPEALSTVHETGAFYYCKLAVEDKVQRPLPPDRGVAKSDGKRYARYSEGLELLGREEFALAQELFEALLTDDSACPMGNTGMGILLANQGREIEARSMLTAVASHGLPIAETHFMIGLLDERVGQYPEALSNYEHALNADATFLMAHLNRALLLKRMGKVEAFFAEMKGSLALLRSSANCPAWATGGLGLEAILGLVAEAVEQDGQDDSR